MASTVVDRLIFDIDARTRNFERAIKKIEGDVNSSSRKMGKGFERFERQIRNTGRTLAAMFGVQLGARAVINYADAWTRVGNSLKVAGVPANQVKGTLERLFDIAQQSGAALEPTVTLFSRLKQSAQELGASQEQLFQFTEGVAAALKVAGTDAASASGALLQLSQAMGSAVVRAEEFNSINEGARPILQAVANGIEETGGSVSRLRQMVIDGNLTSRQFFEGFLRGSEDLKTTAASSTDTVSMAMNRLQNSLTKALGEMNDTTGATYNLVSALNTLSQAIEAIPDIPGPRQLGDAFRKLLNGEVDQPRSANSMGPEFYTPPETPPKPQPLVTTPDKDAIKQENAIKRVIEALKFEQDQIKRTAVEQEIHNQLRAAGTTLATKEGQEIATRVRALMAAREAQEAWDEAIKKTAEEQIEAYNRLHESLMQIGEIGVDALSDFAIEGEKGIEVVKRLAKALAHAAMQALFLGQGPMAGLLGGGGGGGLLGSLLGGMLGGGNPAGAVGSLAGRAAGGPVSAGNAYVVGEKRPEIFVPRVPGTILPSTKMGGGLTVNFAPVINAPNADHAGLMGVKAELAQMKRDMPNLIKGVVTREKQLNPAFGRA